MFKKDAFRINRCNGMLIKGYILLLSIIIIIIFILR